MLLYILIFHRIPSNFSVFVFRFLQVRLLQSLVLAIYTFMIIVFFHSFEALCLFFVAEKDKKQCCGGISNNSSQNKRRYVRMEMVSHETCGDKTKSTSLNDVREVRSTKTRTPHFCIQLVAVLELSWFGLFCLFCSCVTPTDLIPA